MFTMKLKMKLKFWRRSDKNKAKKPSRQQKSKECTCGEYESLRTTVDELRRCIENKIAELQKRLHEFLSFMNIATKEIDDSIELYNRRRKEEKREERLHKAHMMTAIQELKHQHREKIKGLEKAKEEIENAFQHYKAGIEKARCDEQEEMEQLNKEVLALYHKRNQLRSQISNQCPSGQSQTISKSSGIQKPIARCPPLQTQPIIQAPEVIGGLYRDPRNSAFHAYKKEQSNFVTRPNACFVPVAFSLPTAEDDEVAAILSNVSQPGEYIRQSYYGPYGY